jgi:PTS system fructose-specific IIA component/PTS system nitrogen regulatory IIA component
VRTTVVSEATGNFGFPVVDLSVADSSSPDAIVKFLVGQLVQSGRLQAEIADQVVCQVLHRESLGSTGVGRGFALPHSKNNAVKEVLGIFGMPVIPVAWPGALDSEPVNMICLVVTPASEPDASFRALEAVARQFRSQ